MMADSKGVDFEKLLQNDFRWPSATDQLFAAPVHWGTAAVVAQDTDHRHFFMMEGYKEAADLLAEAAASYRPHRDRLLYPVVFCYRHYLELALKYVITTHGQLAGVSPNTEDHDLDKLWPDVRRIIESVDPDNANGPDVEVMQRCVAEFAKIDPGSFTFRYPTSKKGLPVVVAFEYLDLKQLKETMEGIANFFGSLDLYLDNLSKESDASW
jgi:hypothetical protein